jgi:hypothetical protein
MMIKPNLLFPISVMWFIFFQYFYRCCQHFEDVNGEGLLQLKHMRHDVSIGLWCLTPLSSSIFW